MARPKLPLKPLAVYRVLEELREGQERGAVVVGGARELAAALRRELARDGDPVAVREAGLGSLEGAAALVYVFAAAPSEDDERALAAAEREHVPALAVVVGNVPATAIPHVLPADVIQVGAGEGFPLDQLGRLLGRRLGDEASGIAARLPALRRGIVDALIAKAARQNGLVGAAVFVPGADLPVLTLNQLRLVLRIGLAYGQKIDAARVPEIVGVVGAGLGLRAFARQVLGAVPVAGWAIKGGIAYAGTRAVGEAAVRYFEATSGRGTEPRAPRADRA